MHNHLLTSTPVDLFIHGGNIPSSGKFWFGVFGNQLIVINKYARICSEANPANFVKGASKSFFMHYSCMVIILIITYLYNSVFYAYSFKRLVFHVSVFCLFCLFCFEFDVIFIDFFQHLCNYSL